VENLIAPKRGGSLVLNKAYGPDGKTAILRLDGPFGAASEEFCDYRVVMLIGAGIGVTPFASILKSVLLRLKNGQPLGKLQKVYFFWISRDYSAFEWFQSMLAELESELAAAGLSEFLEINIYTTGKVSMDQIRDLHYDQVGDMPRVGSLHRTLTHAHTHTRTHSLSLTHCTRTHACTRKTKTLTHSPSFMHTRTHQTEQPPNSVTPPNTQTTSNTHPLHRARSYLLTCTFSPFTLLSGGDRQDHRSAGEGELWSSSFRRYLLSCACCTLQYEYVVAAGRSASFRLWPLGFLSFLTESVPCKFFVVAAVVLG
jgi:Ferric reductase NAD binding domain